MYIYNIYICVHIQYMFASSYITCIYIYIFTCMNVRIFILSHCRPYFPLNLLLFNLSRYQYGHMPLKKTLKLFTFAIRILYNKLCPILYYPPAFIMIGDHNLSYSQVSSFSSYFLLYFRLFSPYFALIFALFQVLQRANQTTRRIWASLVAIVGVIIMTFWRSIKVIPV